MMAIFLALPFASAFGQTIGHVTGFVNKAYVLRPGIGKVAVSVGLGINAGDIIYTDQKSKVKLLLHDDSILSLSQNSRLVINYFRNDVSSKTRVSRFFVEKGKVFFLVTKKGGWEGRVRVFSPNAIVSIAGTSFIVHYDPGLKVTRVLTVRGLVGVKSAKESLPGVFHVGRGEITTVLDNQNPSQPTIAGKDVMAAFHKAIHVTDMASLANIPGRSGNILDDPTAGVGDALENTAFSSSTPAKSDVEGGTEFDAFDVNDGYSFIPDTALPLPGVLTPDQRDYSDSSGLSENSSVKISVDFNDEPEEEKED